jgi:hypothetical protein
MAKPTVETVGYSWSPTPWLERFVLIRAIRVRTLRLGVLALKAGEKSGIESPPCWRKVKR